VKSNNNDVGGRKFEMSNMAYIIRGLGYIKNKEDIENIALGSNNGIPIRVKDIGTVQMGGDLRLGIFDANGNGEVVGGIVVMRYGENADKVIKAIKTKINDVQKGLPAGVTFKTDYDRSQLIEAAIANIKDKLIEEISIVCIIVILFLLHWRSAMSIIIQIPISIAISFILLNAFGLSSNIMSLTGVALAIGVIVDNGIIMSENAYRHLSDWQNNHGPK
jgi:Cu(I)/Ag(I) efflux system membrane protein CusA/SilA